ncbi:MAG: PAS domain-containing sensor histidine kinase [Myxococcaceae bacterium]
MFPEMVEALPIAVVLVSNEGRLHYANGRARELLEAAGLSSDGAAVEALLTGFRDEDATDRTAITVGTREGARIFGFQATALSSGSKLIAFQDITRIEEAQRERNRLLQLASISEVMPAVLHELKNPLAGIALSLELLIEDSNDERKQRLHAILGEVRRLSLTLDGLGRFRHEVRSARHHAIDLAIREACVLLAPQADSRHIALDVDVPDMPLLPFEPAAVRAVIFNLVTNAIHACREGHRIVVSARFDRETKVLTLVVKDDGAGMAPDVLARCTELFFTTKPRGSGIGLALCAGVAEAVAGRFDVESQQGTGTTISMTFPVADRRKTDVTH